MNSRRDFAAARYSASLRALVCQLSCRTLLAAALVNSAGTWATAEEEAGKAKGKHALLVGCTSYPALDRTLHLEGPGHDVTLLYQLLTSQHYGFSPKTITVLTEPSFGGQRLPTRENIREGFANLARDAGQGDEVVILLAGHGSQQPDNNPPEEPDGWDETFLPRDIGKWDPGRQVVDHAIIDDELGDWLSKIQAKGAWVWIILDSCCSGTGIRGNDVEKQRAVAPRNLGVPEEALAAAARSAEKARGGGAPELVAVELPNRGRGLVALYAAQANETEPEMPLPAASPVRQYHGLLTYTLNEILMPQMAGDRPSGPAPSLTYRQLIRRVHTRYSGLGRAAPTPLMEGNEKDRAVLGQGEPLASRVLLSRTRNGGWKIDAGELQGVTWDSILAVHPIPGQENGSRVLGYVKVLREGLRPLEARVAPCPYKDTPARDGLPDGGLCTPVYLRYGDEPLKVAADRWDDEKRVISPEEYRRLDEALSALVSAPEERRAKSLVKVADPADANWLLRVRAAGKRDVYLVPAEGWTKHDEQESLPPLFGPVPADKDAAPWLQSRLARIALASRLKAIAANEQKRAATQTRASDAAVDVKVELRRYAGAGDAEGKLVEDQGRGIELHKGERIGFRLVNQSRSLADVTLLFIDSGYGITSLFPYDGSNNRLADNESASTIAFDVTSDTVGSECVVALAVRGRPQQQPADYSFLEQPTIERARAVNLNRGAGVAKRGIDSPLGKLLQNACYGHGRNRGLEVVELDDYQLQLLPWRTLSEPRAANPK